MALSPRSDGNVAAGQEWRHKRERWRELYIVSVYEDRLGVARVQVRRNTSRREQSVKITTLLREYVYAGEPNG